MDKVAAARAGAQFESLFLEQILSGLEGSLGQMGSLAIAPLARNIAEHETAGFGALLASALEKRP